MPRVGRWHKQRVFLIDLRYYLRRRAYRALYILHRLIVPDTRPVEPPEPAPDIAALGPGPYLRYALWRGKTHIATLTVYESDWPWTLCHIEAEPAYEQIRGLFDRQLAAVSEMIGEQGKQRWHAALSEVRQLHLILRPMEKPQDNSPQPILLNVLPDGKHALFRVSGTPNVRYTGQ